SAPFVSVLADRDEWVYRDYEAVTRALDGAHRRGNALAEQLTDMQRHHAEAVRQRDALLISKGRPTVDATDPEGLDADPARLVAELATLRTEVSRRAGWRWWLALPLRWLWFAL